MSSLVWRVRLPPYRKLVLLAMSYSADRDGLVELSLAEVSGMTGMDESAVRGHLINLGRGGFVEDAQAPALCRIRRDRLRGAW